LSKVSECFLSRSESWGSHPVARHHQHESLPSTDDGPRCSLMTQLTPEV
jgi:hypothetical protein